MSPTEQGRLCTQCNQQIVDFRGRADLAIGLVHAASELPVCGVYSADQLLGTTGVASRSRLRQLMPVVAGLSVISGGSAAAQVPSSPIEQAPVPGGRIQDATGVALRELQSSAAVDTADALIIRGVVRDSVSDQPLQDVQVMVNGTQIGTLTNQQGEYTLRFSRRQVTSDAPVLVVMLIGYSRVEHEIPSEASAVRLDVILERHSGQCRVLG
jgi:hypothetical protein